MEAVVSLSKVRRALCVVIAAATISGLVATRSLTAASPEASANVTFTASGAFAASPISGNDTLQLAGQPFKIKIVANSSLKPTTHGANWATFLPLNMVGTVYSALVPNQPVAVSSQKAVIAQIVGSTEDIFQFGSPIQVIGIDLQATANITLPGGTLTTALLRPFSAVSLNPSNATITYANGTASTVLAVQSGTLIATIPSGPGVK